MFMVIIGSASLASIIFTSPERPITTVISEPSSSVVFTVFIPSNSALPPNLANNVDSEAIPDAAPPVWKVRRVSCVPGSPIDWAAITPTASPF